MISHQLIKIYFSLSHQKQKTTDTNWSSKNVSPTHKEKWERKKVVERIGENFPK